jgi:DNA-binding GntR family transcriptional regulator
MKTSQDKQPPSNTRSGNTTDRTLDQIRKAIQDGRYAPGQRLIESDLMESFEVTRGPLREALRRLGTEGVVQLIPNRGAIVRMFSLKELFDLFKIRESVEGLAARLAAEKMVDAQARSSFARAIQKIKQAQDDPNTSFSLENQTIHDLILHHADNEQLSLLMKRLQLPIIRFQIRASVDEDYRNASRAEHEDVIEAILSGDSDRAELAMKAHLRQASERTLARANIYKK